MYKILNKIYEKSKFDSNFNSFNLDLEIYIDSYSISGYSKNKSKKLNFLEFFHIGDSNFNSRIPLTYSTLFNPLDRIVSEVKNNSANIYSRFNN